MPRGLHLLLLVPALLVAGCAGAPTAGDDLPPFVPEVAPITSESQAPDEVEARRHLIQGRYEEAQAEFDDLATFEVDPARRAEFLFFSAEAALGAGRHEEAYAAYRKLLRRYPSTPRYPLVVERIFLLGRLYAEGRAESTTWFFGMDMTDRDLGVKILEEFQRARERHPLADDALHWIALARLAQEEHGLAIDAWQKLMDEYPRSEWAETAEFRVGTTFAEMSDGVEYDKRPILTGVQRLRRYVERHPKGNHAAEASQEVARLEEALAGHQVETARFYLQRDEDYAAVLYLDEVLREYPKTEAAREAAALKADLPGVQPPPPRALDEEDEGYRPEDYEPPPPDALPPEQRGLLQPGPND